jgi:hypothetical protein
MEVGEKTCVVLVRDPRHTKNFEVAHRSELLLREVIFPVVRENGFNCTQIYPLDYGINDSALFRILAMADVMIMDILAKSNDYMYSLGVRHALTGKPTFIFAESEQHQPFDVIIPERGIHYMTDYDMHSILGAQDWLRAGLHQAAASHTSYSPMRTALEDAPRVFLSYAHSDRETVAAVDQWLRDRGARVDLDERELIAGRDIRDEIIRLIERAGKVVCFYSSTSSDRYYTNLERRVSEEAERRSHEQGAKRVLLLYFRIDDTPLPPESTHRLAINAWTMSFEGASEELWRHILEKPAEPRRESLATYRDRPPWAKE